MQCFGFIFVKQSISPCTKKDNSGGFQFSVDIYNGASRTDASNECTARAGICCNLHTHKNKIVNLRMDIFKWAFYFCLICPFFTNTRRFINRRRVKWCNIFFMLNLSKYFPQYCIYIPVM